MPEQTDPSTFTPFEKRVAALTVIVSLLAIVGCIAAPIVACQMLLANVNVEGGFFDFDGGCLGGDPPIRDLIERRGGFTFPASAQNIAADSVAPQDCRVYVHFSIDPGDLDTFLASTYVSTLEPAQPAQLGDFRHYIDGDRVVDWQFDSTLSYLYGRGVTGPQKQQDILVDTNDTERVWVYVITWLG